MEIAKIKQRMPTDLYAGAIEWPVLRHRVLVPYVPLPAICSESVPALNSWHALRQLKT